MKPDRVQHRHLKEDDNNHQTSAEEALPYTSRDHTQQEGGYRSGSSGAGTSEKVDRDLAQFRPRVLGRDDVAPESLLPPLEAEMPVPLPLPPNAARASAHETTRTGRRRPMNAHVRVSTALRRVRAR